MKLQRTAAVIDPTGRVYYRDTKFREIVAPRNNAIPLGLGCAGIDKIVLQPERVANPLSYVTSTRIGEISSDFLHLKDEDSRRHSHSAAKALHN